MASSGCSHSCMQGVGKLAVSAPPAACRLGTRPDHFTQNYLNTHRSDNCVSFTISRLPLLPFCAELKAHRYSGYKLIFKTSLCIVTSGTDCGSLAEAV